jgi:hypothetical protein
LNKFTILALVLLPLTATAADLPNVPVGPIDFNEVPTREAIRSILAGTDILPTFHLPPAGTVTAKNVKGQLPDVMKHLSTAVGFTYQYKDKVLTISSLPSATPVIAASSMKAAAAAIPPQADSIPSIKKSEPIPAPNVVIKLKKGDNIHAILEAAAKENHYALNWEGEELYSKYETSFESASFDKSVDSLLIAIKVNGYISGNVIYVVVK